MRIAVASVQVPFIYGGAERHSENLCTALREHGHEATAINLPFKWYPPRTLVDHVMATKFIDITESNGVPIDLLIGLKFPAYLLRHPKKVLWILHQHRQAYDLWDHGQSELLKDPEGPAIREFIRAEDVAAFNECKDRLFTNSDNVSKRIDMHLGIRSTPLYHPPAYADLLRADIYSDYIFVPSRICDAKRQKLLIEALSQTSSRIKMVIAGPPDVPGYEKILQKYARELGVDERITWLGSVSDVVMADFYSRARAVAFAPIDEDYGYVTLEAMLSHKAVITTVDSGGPLEFIRNRCEGIVTVPSAKALAKAFDEMAEDISLAEKMGEAGYNRYASMKINWTHVVSVLTGQSTNPVQSEARSANLLPEDARPNKQESVPVATIAEEKPLKDIQQRFGLPESGQVAPAFTHLAALFSFYNFKKYGSIDDLKGYFGTHWTRYIATLAFVPKGERLRILDVGIFPPFVFQALLKASVPSAEILGIWEGPACRYRIESLSPEYPSFDIDLHHANVDKDNLPFDDNAFDVVLGLEILEHLAINPLLFLQEIARVLRPGGQLIISTPNIASHRGVAKILRQESPYSFGIFVPTGGVYGRHNREYTAHEVERLGQAAGFETIRLLTSDVYDTNVNMEIIQLLESRDDKLEFRGETIFYSARRGEGIGTKVPDNLYHGDPNQLSGHISLDAYDPETGLGRLLVSNTSRAIWLATGSNKISLYAEWFDTHGRLVHDGLHLPLKEPVLPGHTSRVNFGFGVVRRNAARIGTEGEVCIELYQGGAGRMKGAGRANSVRVPCVQEAFLDLCRRTVSIK